MRYLRHDTGGTGRLAFAPDGWLFGLFGPRLLGWDPAGSDRPGWAADADGRIARRLACSPCGRWLVAADLRAATVYDRVPRPGNPAARNLGLSEGEGFAPTAPELYVVKPGAGLRRRRLPAAGQSLAALAPPEWLGGLRLTWVPRRFAISPDGARLAAEYQDFGWWGGARQRLALFDLATGARLATVTAGEFPADSLGFTDGGAGVLRGDARTLTRFDAPGLSRSAEWAAGGAGVEDVATSPDGRVLLVGSGGRVTRLDPTTLAVDSEFDLALGAVTRVAVARDGLTAAACGSSGAVVVVDLC